MRKARGMAKTNKKDADLLSLLAFETDSWWRVWLAPPDVRDAREWMRHRASLVQTQTQTKNRIAAVLHRHGILHAFSDLYGVGGRAFLGDVCRHCGTAEVSLPAGAVATLTGLLALLGHVRGQLARIAQALRGQLQRSDLARRLDGIPGVGLILSHTLIAEIGRIDRFRDHRALGSYSLLAPIAHDTGEQTGKPPLGRHLGHRGNRTLKWAFIEAAHGAVRKGGKWRRLFDSVTDGGQRNRSRGYIQVARELVKVVYVVWKKNVEYSDTPPPRPGSSPRQRSEAFLQDTRPGTGQPCRPMAAVR
jgi:transposase